MKSQNYHIPHSNTTQQQAKFDIFYDTINMIQDTCQPLKTIVIKNDKPWMTPYIKSLIQQRQHLYHNGSHDQWLKMANLVRHHTRKRVKIYYNRFKNKDAKMWWKTVNEVNGKSSNKQNIQIPVEELNNGFHQVWEGQKQPDLSGFIKPPSEQQPQKNETGPRKRARTTIRFT